MRLAGSYFQCTGVVTTYSPTYRCCLVTESEIQYRKPGNMILYSKYATPAKCQTGWTGRNCDACAPNFGPPGRCDACLTVGLGRTVTYVSLDSNATTNCNECIKNGKWNGTRGVTMIVYLTFDGPRCSDLVPGRCFLRLPNLYQIFQTKIIKITRYNEEKKTRGKM